MNRTFLRTLFVVGGGFAASAGLVAVEACTPATPVAPVASEALTAAAAGLVGTWSNDRGSVLVIDTVDADGHFHGAFRSGVGKVDAAQAFPVSGLANGDVIGFSVAFGGAGSVASWAGQLTRGMDEGGAEEDRLVTTWHLVRDVADADEAASLWESTRTGADTFRRTR